MNKLYEVVVSFLNPSQMVATVKAASEEEAKETVLRDLMAQAPGLENVEVIEVKQATGPSILLDNNGNPQ